MAKNHPYNAQIWQTAPLTKDLIQHTCHGPSVVMQWNIVNIKLSPTPGVYSNSCPLSQWCHPTISSSVAPFSSCLQSFPTSGSWWTGRPGVLQSKGSVAKSQTQLSDRTEPKCHLEFHHEGARHVGLVWAPQNFQCHGKAKKKAGGKETIL